MRYATSTCRSPVPAASRVSLDYEQAWLSAFFSSGEVTRDLYVCVGVFFFFQAEDGIRDDLVTGVQTCALPIFAFAAAIRRSHAHAMTAPAPTAMPLIAPMIGRRQARIASINRPVARVNATSAGEIGRASCRERV